MARIENHKKAAIEQMILAGASYRQIQKIVGVSKQTVQTAAQAVRGEVGAICMHDKQRYLCKKCRPNGIWNKPASEILAEIKAAHPKPDIAKHQVEVSNTDLMLLAASLSEMATEIERLVFGIREKLKNAPR